MFTGLVQAVGVVRHFAPPAEQGVVRLALDPGTPMGAGWPPREGDSISVSGVCLTVARAVGSNGLLHFDVVPQTLSLTMLSDVRPGSRVNLEACVTPATLLGGHLVQGHVDGVGTVERVERGREHRVRILAPGAVAPSLTPQGSVCVDGVSLTIASLDPAPVPAWFEVALVPTTLAKTTLADLVPGARVNLEGDVIAKMVAVQVARLRAGGGG